MTNKNKSEIWVFIIPCLLMTGAVMLIAGHMRHGTDNQAADFLAAIACLMPAINAIVICVLKKPDLSETRVLPGFRENAAWYAGVIVLSVAMALAGEPISALFFPEAVRFESFRLIDFVFSVLLIIEFSLPSVIFLLGEEFGWLGYLFPRLEKMYGTIMAVVLMAVIRGGWHLIMLLAIGGEDILMQFVMVTISNLALDSVLVYVTKKTDSIIPATIIHTLTNALPKVYTAFLTVNASVYAENEIAIQMTAMVPSIIAGAVCYILLYKEALLH